MTSGTIELLIGLESFHMFIGEVETRRRTWLKKYMDNCSSTNQYVLNQYILFVRWNLNAFYGLLFLDFCFLCKQFLITQGLKDIVCCQTAVEVLLPVRCTSKSLKASYVRNSILFSNCHQARTDIIISCLNVLSLCKIISVRVHNFTLRFNLCL